MQYLPTKVCVYVSQSSFRVKSCVDIYIKYESGRPTILVHIEF